MSKTIEYFSEQMDEPTEQDYEEMELIFATRGFISALKKLGKEDMIKEIDYVKAELKLELKE